MSQRAIDVTGAPVYLPYEYQGQASDGTDVVTVNAQVAPSVRNAEELAAKIKATRGKFTVNASSSDLIVALNNTLRFSVARNTAGNYEITDRLNASNLTLLALVAGAALLVVIAVKQ